MSEQEKQENQKTIVAFAAGLLIGGLLVWVFGGATPKTVVEDTTDNATSTEEVADTDTATDTDDTAEDTEDAETPELQTGTGAVEIGDQKPGTTVALESATFPSDEGWVGVRDFVDGQIGGILGVARFSKVQGLVPQEITLQRSTKAGSSYAIVFFSENGDRVFNVANDIQSEGAVETFTVSDK
jgi:hypothetical protein